MKSRKAPATEFQHRLFRSVLIRTPVPASESFYAMAGE